MIEISSQIKNKDLLLASEHAYGKGKKIDLNPDYKMVEKDIVLFDIKYKASIWVNFKKEGMYANFTLEKGGAITFKKEIDKSKNGIEFFLEIYSSIDVKDNIVIIRGRKDVEYLPLKIIIEKNNLVF